MSKKKTSKIKDIEISAPTNFRSLNVKENDIFKNLANQQQEITNDNPNTSNITEDSPPPYNYDNNEHSNEAYYDDQVQEQEYYNNDDQQEQSQEYDDYDQDESSTQESLSELSSSNKSINNTFIQQPTIPSASTKPTISLSTYIQQQQQLPTQQQQNNEKIYFKVSPQLLKEVKEWEDKKVNYSQAIELLLEKKSKQLDEFLNGYIEELKPILSSFNFDDQLKNSLLDREHSRLVTVKEKLFGAKNASISVLEEKISNKKREINMHNKITLIQAVVRGWLQRKRYKTIRNRNKCCKEIVETERNYYQNLSIIVNRFLVPLQTSKKDILSNNEITSIFSNVSLIHGVHKELLESLEKNFKNWNNEKCLAHCFLNLTPFLKLYSQYINNFNHATTTLNECKKRDQKVKDFFFKDCKGGELGTKDFLDFQILPVQRIPRYKLLLTDLLRYTPEVHKDYENIKLALKEIQNLATSINESKREAEGFEKTIHIQSSLTKNLEIIQPFRKHIKDSPIQFEKRGKLKDRHLFLFNDSILLCKKQNAIFDSQPRYSPITLMKLAGSIVLLAEDPEFKNGFAILGCEHLYFYTKTPVEQLEWFLIVKQVVADIEQNDSTIKRVDSDLSKESPIVRESMSMKFQNSNPTPNNSNNTSVSRGNIFESPTPSSSNLSNVTIANPRNSIKIENSKNSQPNHPIVIERNSKILDHSNVVSNNSNNGLHFSPTSSSNIFPPLSNINTNNVSPTSSSNNIFPPLQSLSASTTPSPTYSVQPPSPALNLTIRELITIFNDINQLQNQLFQPTNQLEVVFGNYIKSINPNELNQNFQKINDLLSKIINLKSRSIAILKEDEITSNLQNIITQGKDNIGSFNSWIKQAFPLGTQDPNSQQPRNLIINLMKWYNNLHKVWTEVLDHK